MLRFRTAMMWLVAMLSVWSCQTQQPSDNYSIEGEAEGFADGDTLYLSDANGRDLPFEMAVVENGKFNISGITDSSQFCILYSQKQGHLQIPLFIEPGKILLHLTPDGESVLGGTENNEKLQAYNDSLQLYEEQVIESRDALYGSAPTRMAYKEASRQAEEETERLNAYLARCLEDNINNELGYYILVNEGHSLSAEQRLSFIHQLPARLRERPEIVEMEESLTTAAPQEATVSPTELTATVLSLPDDGSTTLPEEVSKHSITIIQFWASWNTPYFRELAELKRLYRRYSDMGLGMIGVSLDNDDKAWQSSIDKNGLSWTQLSDLKGWESELISAYQVGSLPYYMIVDRTGKILATGITVEDISNEVRQALQP